MARSVVNLSCKKIRYMGLIIPADKPVVKTMSSNLRNCPDKGLRGRATEGRWGRVSGTFFQAKPAPRKAIIAYPTKVNRQAIPVDKELIKPKPAKTPIISPRVWSSMTRPISSPRLSADVRSATIVLTEAPINDEAAPCTTRAR